MRVVYYTHPAFLEPALHFIRELSRETELHVFIEISPGALRSGPFEVQQLDVGAGLVPGDAALASLVPETVRAFWSAAASFNLAVHGSARSFHPASWAVGHKVMRAVGSMRPDVFYADTISRRLAGNLLELGRVPLVTAVHDPQLHIGEHNWRTEVVRRLSYRRVNRFVLHSGALRASFCLRYGLSESRVRIVHLAPYDVVRSWADRDVPQERATVLFFGRLAAYKGLEVLMEAAPAVAQQIPGVRFMIAGNRTPGYALPALPHLENGGCFEVLDRYIPPAELAQLLQRAAVVICPYIDASQSGVILTAYAFDRAVIASNVGGLPEYVDAGKTGLLVPPGDPGALARAVTQMLRDMVFRERLQANVAALRDEQLSWGTAASQLLDVFAATTHA